MKINQLLLQKSNEESREYSPFKGSKKHFKSILLLSSLVMLFIILQSFITMEIFYNDKTEDAVVAADAMNVLYVGIDNPLSIAVPNVNSNEIIVSISGVEGTIIKQEGCKYLVRITGRGVATIHVHSKTKNGTVVEVGQKQFKARALPRPVAYWGSIGNNGLPIPRAAIIAQNEIVVSLGSGFAFSDLKYEVVSFQFVFDPGAGNRGDPFVKRVNGGKIDLQIKDIIRRGKPGDRIIVDMIRAKGPDGVRNLSPICLVLQ